jgi:nitrate/nitrite-specific signal transduction histidine kinase
MESRRELFVGIGSMVGMNVLVAFGAVALLTRMTPAIAHILEDNVESMRAADQVLAVLAVETDSHPSDQAQQRVQSAISRLRENVTEQSEITTVASIERRWRSVLDAQPGARAALVTEVLELVATNRRAMQQADAEAKRLGTAGAWATASLGIVALFMSVVILRRLSRRVLNPLAELFQTLKSAEGGDPFRRCTPVDCTSELQQVMHAVNALLDTRAAGSPQTHSRPGLSEAP